MSPTVLDCDRKKLESWNECANCGVPVGGGNNLKEKQASRISAFIIREKSQKRTVKVSDALSEVYRLHANTNLHKLHLVLCNDCSLIFPQLYKLYRDFSHRSTPDSILARRCNRVDGVLARYVNSIKVSLPGDRRGLQRRPHPHPPSHTVEIECTLPPELDKPPPEEVDPLAITTMQEGPVHPENVHEDINVFVNNLWSPKSERPEEPFQKSNENQHSYSKGVKRKAESESTQEIPRPPDRNKDSCSCKCGRNFQTAFQLKCHAVYCGTPSDLEKLASNRFQCPDCRNSFNTDESLKAHYHRMHNAPYFAPLTCKLCPSKFILKDKLQEHMMRIHFKTKASDYDDHTTTPPPPKRKSSSNLNNPTNPTNIDVIPSHQTTDIIVQSYIHKYLGKRK